MTEDLTRRRFYVLAGASAAVAAGLSASGCAIRGANIAGRGIVSRPDLTPPLIAVRRYGHLAASKYVFLDAPYSGPGHGGTIILDCRGELVWLGPNTAAHHKMDFDAQMLNGEPVLT